MNSTTTKDRSSNQTLTAWWRRWYNLDNPWTVALGYLLLLTLAEVLTTLITVQVGLFSHMILLFLILFQAAVRWQEKEHRFLLGIAFVPLIRIVSVTLPLVGLPLMYWYLITSVPLFAAAAVVVRLLGFTWRDLSIRQPGWFWQLLIGLSGIGLGIVEYHILRPEPLAPALTLADIWFPALILLISTGYLEELIFRFVMQRTAVEYLGRWTGIIYVALFFAVLHIGYKSLIDFFFVLVVGLAFGVIVHYSRNLLGVTLAHGLTNIWLFLVMPFVATVAPPGEPAPVIFLSPPATVTVTANDIIATPSAAASLQATPEAIAIIVTPTPLPDLRQLTPVSSPELGRTTPDQPTLVVGLWQEYGSYILLLLAGFVMTILLALNPLPNAKKR